MMKDKKFRIKYSVHCHCKNHFGKETIVKNVMNELQAKVELRAYCEKNYAEFEHIKITRCEEIGRTSGMFSKEFEELLNTFKIK